MKKYASEWKSRGLAIYAGKLWKSAKIPEVKQTRAGSQPQPGCHLPDSPWLGIIFIPIPWGPGRVWLVTSWLGTGKSLAFFTVLIPEKYPTFLELLYTLVF